MCIQVYSSIYIRENFREEVKPPEKQRARSLRSAAHFSRIFCLISRSEGRGVTHSCTMHTEWGYLRALSFFPSVSRVNWISRGFFAFYVRTDDDEEEITRNARVVCVRAWIYARVLKTRAAVFLNSECSAWLVSREIARGFKWPRLIIYEGKQNLTRFRPSSTASSSRRDVPPLDASENQKCLRAWWWRH